MKTSSILNKWLVNLAISCVGLLVCMIIVAQMSPVYAGSHNSKQDNDIGSITAGNSTKYYGNVPDLLDDLEEYDECTITVEMFKDWYMGKDCQWIEIDSGSDRNHTRVKFNMNGYTIDRNIPNEEYDDDYLVFYIGKYAEVTIDGGWHDPMDTKCFKGNGYGGGWDATYYYKGGGIVGGRFDESMWSSPEGGGGIFLASYSDLTLKNVTVGGCKSVDGEGGGVYVDSYSTLNMINSSVKGCQTIKQGGGGIYLAGSATLNMDNSVIYSNGSYEEGGGILIDEENAAVNLKNNSSIEGNRATDNGGGIAILNDNNVIRGDDELSSSIKNNRVTYSSWIDLRHNGGGVYFENPGIIENVKLEGNSTNYGNGGGIFLASDKLANELYTVENCIFELNSAADTTSTLTCSEGGGIYVDDAGTEIRDCSFHYNSAYNAGGGIYINAEDVKVSDCILEKNSADCVSDGYDFRGGGAYVNKSNPVFKNCQFINNRAKSQGGGIFVNSNNNFSDCARFTGKIIIKDNEAGDRDTRIQENNLYVDQDDFVQFYDLLPGSRIYLGSGGYKYEKHLSSYDNRTDESQKKYLTLEDDDPEMILDFSLSDEYKMSLRILKKETRSHIVKFDSNGGSEVAEQTVMESKTIKEPKDPVKEGSVFKGWHTEADVLWDFNHSVYEDMTLHAEWFDGYKISFFANTGAGTMDPVYRQPGKYTLPECGFAAPEGKKFDCWKIITAGEDSMMLKQGDEITITDKEVKVYAQWKDVPAEVSITLIANNGTDDSRAETAAAGDYTLPECDFEAPKNMKFKGWAYMADGDVIEDEAISLEEDISLYAIWVAEEKKDPEYTVPTGLEGRCGEILDSIQLPKGFVWSDKTRKIHGIHDDTFFLTYIPEDTDRYNIVENIEVKIKVNHEFSHREQDATCTRGKTVAHICNICGDGYAEETGDPIGHEFGEWTETADGDRQRTCKTCGFTETAYKESSIHNFEAEKSIDKAATPAADGSMSYHCTDEGCNAVKDSEVIEAVSYVTLSQGIFDYDGEAKTTEAQVFDRANNRLTKGKDYELAFPEDCTDAGSKVVTVKMKDKYDGKLYAEYVIVPVSIVREHPELEGETFTYTGKGIKPQVRAGNLVENEDFMVEYQDNIKAGTATAVINGTGNYTGRKTLEFEILPVDASELKASLSAKTYTYTGKLKKPVVTVRTAAGNLIDKSNYTVTYSKNKSVGTARVKVTFNGKNCTGTKTLSFKIKPAKAKVSKLTAGTKKLTVKMSSKPSVKGGSKYQVAYKVKGTSKWKYTTSTGQSKVIKNLKKGKKYYVKVRAYKSSYKGAWSKTVLSSKIK